MPKLNINGTERSVEAAPDTPLLWVLRDHLDLTGTKFGCGIAACGACTVHVEGVAVRSCVVPLASVAGKKVRTIEDLGRDQLTKLQQAWIRHQVPQCGYCQSGMLMAASALLDKIPTPSDADIDREITNICRCGTYQRIRAAIRDASTAAPALATREVAPVAAIMTVVGGTPALALSSALSALPQAPGGQAPGGQAPGGQAPGGQAPGRQAPATSTSGAGGGK